MQACKCQHHTTNSKVLAEIFPSFHCLMEKRAGISRFLKAAWKDAEGLRVSEPEGELSLPYEHHYLFTIQKAMPVFKTVYLLYRRGLALKLNLASLDTICWELRMEECLPT